MILFYGGLNLEITKNKKILVVGDGAVGSSFVFSAVQNGIADEIVIVDLKKDQVEGDALDLEDVTAFTTPTIIRQGTYEDAQDADIVVITAGVPRKPGETRLDLVGKNAKILKTIIKPVVDSGFSGIFVVSSNPVDILTNLTRKLSGFPINRIIGTGTSLDSARLQVALAKQFKVSINNVIAYVLGEHGDSQFVNISNAKIGSQSLKDALEQNQISEDNFNELVDSTVKKGGQIISKKGATFYGIATSLMTICRAILNNENLVLPVSAPLSGQYGINGLYIGSPAVINEMGIGQVIEVSLDNEEKIKMTKSAKQMENILKSIEF